jgi:DNA repair protein RecO (recombination protein O)
MIHKTPGIVLHSFRYGETSVIARIFTRELGIQSFLAPGVRKSRPILKYNLFQPLTPVEMVVYYKESGGLSRIREIRCPHPLSNIPYDILKSSVAIFLSEIMARSFREQEPNAGLFDFILEAIGILDRLTGRVSEFHLVFLLQLTRFLGFQPRNNHSTENGFFNLREGLFDRSFESGELCLDREMSRIFHEINNTGLNQLAELNIPSSIRRALLKKTVDYYRYHLQGMGEIKSLAVLEAVLHQ